VKKFKLRRLEKGSRIPAPQDESDPPDDEQRPKFCLQYLADKFCISRCTREEKAAFADRLRELSSLTWRQLRQAGRGGQGYETIAQDSIKAPIPTHITEDVRLIAFRFFGKAPMVGYRERTVFHIVWFDRQFKLYDHS
jgi:hypothetical protein